MRHLLLLLLASIMVGGCRTEPGSRPTGGDAPLYLVTTPPLRLILEEATGNVAGVEPLLTGTTSPHTHDPRPSHARMAARSMALFYGAPSLDAWAADLDAPRAIATLALVPDSMQLRLPNGSDVDPHFWVDPLTVRSLLPALADTLCSLDADRCPTYRTRTRAFAVELDSLHADLSDRLAPLRGDTVMLSHPFFRYFAQRYGITVVALIEPAPGSEPSPRVVRNLIDQAQADGVDAVLSMPQHPSRAARAVAEAAGLPFVELDPLGHGETASYADLLHGIADRLLEGLQ